MAIRNFPIDGKVGANLTDVYASSPPFTVGERVRTTNGGEFIFVQTEADVSAFNYVVIRSDASASALTANVQNFKAKNLSTGNVDTAAFIGVAQVDIASAFFGWIALSGNNLRGKGAIAIEPNLPLFTTATGGVVDDATVSAGYLQNVVALTSAASASAVPIQIGGFIVAGMYGAT